MNTAGYYQILSTLAYTPHIPMGGVELSIFINDTDRFHIAMGSSFNAANLDPVFQRTILLNIGDTVRIETRCSDTMGTTTATVVAGAYFYLKPL